MAPENDKRHKGNGAWIISALVGLVAIICGVFSMTKPMSQRVDFLERQIIEMRRDMSQDDDRERDDIKLRGSLIERFREVETQFNGLDRRVCKYEEWVTWWQQKKITDLEERINKCGP